MKYDIFISYRREGGDTLAQLVYDRLRAKGYRVFLDIESLRAGKFNEKLLSVIDECRDVVVILPPGALERCKNEGDWVYQELIHAIRGGKNIIPIMMKGFEWPEELPEGMEELPHMNGIRDSKDYFDAVIDKMAGMLKSKPALFGNQNRKRRKPYDLRGLWKKRRNLIVAALLAALALAAALLIPGRIRDRKLDRMADMVQLVLNPDEEMSASEYYDAQEILKRRFQILADGEKYTFEVSKDKIEVAIPLEVFHEIPVEKAMKCYVTRPTELYVALENYPDDPYTYVPVTRSEVEEVTLKTEKAAELNLDAIDTRDYKLPEQDTYECVELRLSKEVVAQIKEAYGEQEVYRLIQDDSCYPSGKESYFYWMFPTDEDNCFVVIDNYQQDNICRLVVDNYQNDTFSKAFTFYVQMPVKWEEKEKASVQGEQQCDVLALSEEDAAIQLTFSTDQECTEGEFFDAIHTIKKRMDLIGLPYAFGYTLNPGHSYDISVRTSAKRMNEDISEIICSSSSLSVEGAFYELLKAYNLGGAEVREKTDGTYELALIPTENHFDREEFERNLSQIEQCDNDSVYLYLGLRRIAKAKASDAVKDGIITFDRLDLWGLEQVGKEDVFLLELLKALAEDTGSPNMWYHVEGRTVNEEFGMKDGEATEQAEYEEKLGKIAPGADIRMRDGELYVYLNMDIDEKLLEQANQLLQQIYHESGVENGEIEQLTVYCNRNYEDSVEYFFCRFWADTSLHAMRYSGAYGGKKLEAYKEQFKNLIEKDPFYTENFPEDAREWSFYE